MKKSKRLRQAEAGAGRKPSQPNCSAGPQDFIVVAVGGRLAALFLAFEIYGPALNGRFVLDDLYFPFRATHNCSGLAFLAICDRFDAQLLMAVSG